MQLQSAAENEIGGRASFEPITAMSSRGGARRFIRGIVVFCEGLTMGCCRGLETQASWTDRTTTHHPAGDGIKMSGVTSGAASCWCEISCRRASF